MSSTAAELQSNSDIQPALSPVKGLLVLIAIIALVALFVAINHTVNIAEVWAGFLFILYWAGLQHLEMDKLLPSALGSLTGLALAYAMYILPSLLGGGGLAIAIGLIVIAVYCQIMGWLPVIINFATMIFLTVGTIPAVQQYTDLPKVFAALILGIIFIVICAGSSRLVMQKFGKK